MRKRGNDGRRHTEARHDPIAYCIRLCIYRFTGLTCWQASNCSEDEYTLGAHWISRRHAAASLI